MAERGFSSSEKMEVVKCWPFACVLQGNNCYCKACLPSAGLSGVFAPEAQVMKLLAQKYATLLPPLVAINEEQGWILMQDAGALLEQQEAYQCWEQVLQQWAGLQQVTSQEVEELLARGVPDRRIVHLPQHLAWLLDDGVAMTCFSSTEVRRIEQSIPLVEKLCHQLASYQIPATLTHGDLHPKNIACAGDRLALLDWSDGCLSHPFFDAVRFCSSTLLQQQPVLQAALSTSYLACWSQFEPMERLQEAMRFASLLSRVHLAVSFYQSMRLVWLPALEASFTFEMRMFLRTLATTQEPRV
jgi:hypothetical protein